MKKAIQIMCVALFLCGPLCSEGRADFSLWNNEQLTVNTSHSQGVLYDQSRAEIVSGGSASYLYAYDTSTAAISGGSVSGSFQITSSGTFLVGGGLYAYDTSTAAISGGTVGGLIAYATSTVDISGGAVGYFGAYSTNTATISGGSVGRLEAYAISDVKVSDGSVDWFYAYATSTVDISGGAVGYMRAYDTSVVNISGGSVYGVPSVSGNSFHAYDSSTVNISGGSVNELHAYDTSVVNISGGSVSYLDAYGTSAVTFNAREFRLGDGLSLDGERLLGIGILSGEWFDGTRWMANISQSRSGAGATILVIPEPATLSLLALGGLAMLRRRRA